LPENIGFFLTATYLKYLIRQLLDKKKLTYSFLNRKFIKLYKKKYKKYLISIPSLGLCGL